MRQILLVLCISLSLFASDSLGYANQPVKVYSVRFLSVPLYVGKEKVLHSIPKRLQADTRILQSGKYLTAMYKERTSHLQTEKDLQMLKEAGYKDAYIRARKRVVSTMRQKQKSAIRQPSKQKKQKKFSRFIVSRIISKANNAYKNGNYMQAIIEYEILMSAKEASWKVKKNLCYLYGREGAFEQAERIIEDARNPSNLIYAYAYGSATTMQENYYSNLSKYIPYDKSGRLMLLSGYYFEQKKELKRALAFYKMAYEKNPLDSYNIYAYARAADISGDYKKALELYKKVLREPHVKADITTAVKNRINQLGE